MEKSVADQTHAWRRRLLVALSGLAALLASGCAAEVGSPTYQQASVPIEDASPDEVFSVARDLLAAEFPRLAADRSTYTIRTEPVEFTVDRDSGTARDLLGGASRLRRYAEFTTAARDGSTRAWLRVMIERKDTDRQVTLTPATGKHGETPAYTPIEVDAATTEAQNTVWTRVRRDRGLERALLRDLQAQFAPPVTADEPVR